VKGWSWWPILVILATQEVEVNKALISNLNTAKRKRIRKKRK
jgi:hypothetical protein